MFSVTFRAGRKDVDVHLQRSARTGSHAGIRIGSVAAAADAGGAGIGGGCCKDTAMALVEAVATGASP
jgi:hypothetical protein